MDQSGLTGVASDQGAAGETHPGPLVSEIIPGFVIASDVMLELLKEIRLVSRSDAPVLITGETGTGKELVARAVHTLSPRYGKPFLAINCAALPENIIESELFGHKRGTFTGAITDKIGLFVAADGGTVFLDEISELPLALQAKLLRFLEEHEVRILGSTRSVKVDIRVIAASNSDLAQMIREKEFRSDLYYRIDVLNLHVPPLRDRADDVEPLIRHFLKEGRGRERIFTPEALNTLRNYPWPGNVRELWNMVTRLQVMTTNPVITLQLVEKFLARNQRLAALPPTKSPTLASLRSARGATAVAMRQHLARQLLEQYGGNKDRAARAAGVGYSSFRRYLAGKRE